MYLVLACILRYTLQWIVPDDVCMTWCWSFFKKHEYRELVMKKNVAKVISILWILTAIFFTGQAHATFIARASFGPAAVTYDFSGAPFDSPIAISGILTVSGGAVFPRAVDPLVIPTYSNAGAGGNPPGNPIRLDFSSVVSAVGFDVHYNHNPVLFEVYNSLDVLLDSFFGSPNDFTPITGYIGLDVGAPNISYTIISVPALPTTHNLVIDNIIYQASIPEPTTLALMGLGLAGIGWKRRKAA